MTRTASAQVSAAVLAALVPAARYAALVVQNSPAGSSAWLLARPDINATLADALEEARSSAAAVVSAQWGDAPPDPVLAHLLADIARQYDALSRLRGAIRDAHASAEPAERPAAVRRAIISFARATALRSRLTAVVAQTAAEAARTLAEGRARKAAGEKVRKRWEARPGSCYWCRRLHGVTIGLDESFLPYLGGPADLTGHGHPAHPPKPYRGVLDGSSLHPHCRCRIAIVSEDAPAPDDSLSPAARFVTAAQIRAMPEERYRSLSAFLRAAVHELKQMLGRIVSAV